MKAINTLLQKFGVDMTLKRVSSTTYNEYDEAEHTYEEVDVKVLMGTTEHMFVQKEDGFHEFMQAQAIVSKDVEVGKGDLLDDWVVDVIDENSLFKKLILRRYL